MSLGSMHISRSWPDAGTPLEDACPCPKERCGCVAWDRVVPECDQHTGRKTIRAMHSAEDCPARRREHAMSDLVAKLDDALDDPPRYTTRSTAANCTSRAHEPDPCDDHQEAPMTRIDDPCADPATPVQWMDADSTILVMLWTDGTMQVATRPEAGASWGPPVAVKPDGGPR